MTLHELPISPLIDQLIDLALIEDIGHGDITTESLNLRSHVGTGRICAKEPLVVAGLQVVKRVFEKIDPDIAFITELSDGEWIELAGTVVAEVKGSLHALLIAERTALNFLQRMSGVATHVRAFVKIIPKSGIRLVDTRKTVPGWRVLEKYAVRVGGGFNHRMGLYDGILIKDNHIAACGGIAAAVKQVRANAHHLLRVEVETSDLDEVQTAIEAGADVIMLDNMDRKTMAEAVEMIGGRAEVEVSGQVSREILESLDALGIDIVSVGALTHAARFVDLSMDIVPDPR